LEFLGHMVSADSSAPTVEQTAAIKQCTNPQDVKQLQLFLSMVNF